jgi:hypothetical protein
MSNVVLFTPGATLPAYMLDKEALKERSLINADVITGPTYPVLSIKGKVFTLIKGNDKKVLTRADDPDAALQFVNLTVVRANTKSRVFFAKAYVEGSEGVEARPDCYSVDGIVPAADAQDRQAPKCQICPHAVWGSRANMEGKGTACSVNTRAAVIDPENVVPGEKLEPFLLRIPAGSRTNFADVVKAAEQRKIPYNALVLKVGFDNEAPAPKLTFKLVGLLDDVVYAAATAAYNDETVEDMLGYRAHEAPVAAPPTEADADMEAILAKKAADEAAATAAAVEAAAAAERARQAAARPAPAAAAAPDLGGLDALMGAPATTPPAAAPAAAVAPPVVPATPAAAAAAPAPRRRRTQAEMAAARAAAAAGTATPAAAAPAAVAPPPVQPAVAPAAAADHSDLLGNLDALLEATDD